MYKISNSFHNTAAGTKYSPEQRHEIEERIATGTATDAERQAMRRAKKKLCGFPQIAMCSCSDGWGERY